MEKQRRGRKTGSVGMVQVIRLLTVKGKASEVIVDTFPVKELPTKMFNLKEGRYIFKTFAKGGSKA